MLEFVQNPRKTVANKSCVDLSQVMSDTQIEKRQLDLHWGHVTKKSLPTETLTSHEGLDDNSLNKDSLTYHAAGAVTANGLRPVFENRNLSEFSRLLKRRFLGTITYCPSCTWESIQTHKLYGLQTRHRDRFEEIKRDYVDRLPESNSQSQNIPCIPPLGLEYANSLLQVKIPRHYLDARLNSTLLARKVWGGYQQVYSDDSDVAAMAVHMGLLDGSADLCWWNPHWTPACVVKPGNLEQSQCDLSVTILLLPPLQEYQGFYANGINSRTWSKHNLHSGLSMTIYSFKWELPDTYLDHKSLFKDFEYV